MLTNGLISIRFVGRGAGWGILPPPTRFRLEDVMNKGEIVGLSIATLLAVFFITAVVYISRLEDKTTKSLTRIRSACNAVAVTVDDFVKCSTIK